MFLSSLLPCVKVSALCLKSLCHSRFWLSRVAVTTERCCTCDCSLHRSAADWPLPVSAARNKSAPQLAAAAEHVVQCSAGCRISPLSVPVSCSVRVPTKHEVGGGWCQLRLVGAQSCRVRVQATVGAGHGEVSSVSHRDFQLYSGRDHCSNMMQLCSTPDLALSTRGGECWNVVRG